MQAATRMADGQWPWRDFGWSYGPGQPLVVMVLGKLFDPSLLWWRLLRVAADATCAVLVYALVRPRGGARWALAAWAAAAVTVAQPTSANPTGPALAFALAAVLFATRARPGWAGAMAALAAFWRPDVGRSRRWPRRRRSCRARRRGARGRAEGGGAATAACSWRRSAQAGRDRRGDARGGSEAWRWRRGRPRHARRGARPRGALPCARLPARRRRACCSCSTRRSSSRPGPATVWDALVVQATRDGEWWRLPFPDWFAGGDVEGLPGVACAVRGAADPRAGRPPGSGERSGSWSSGRERRSTSSHAPTSSTRRRCWWSPRRPRRSSGRGSRAACPGAADPRRRRPTGRARCSGPPDLAPYGERARAAARGGRRCRGWSPLVQRLVPPGEPIYVAPLRSDLVTLQQPADPLPHRPPERAAPRRAAAGQAGGAGTDRRARSSARAARRSCAGPPPSPRRRSPTAAGARAARARSTSTSRAPTSWKRRSGTTRCSGRADTASELELGDRPVGRRSADARARTTSSVPVVPRQRTGVTARSHARGLDRRRPWAPSSGVLRRGAGPRARAGRAARPAPTRSQRRSDRS